MITDETNITSTLTEKNKKSLLLYMNTKQYIGMQTMTIREQPRQGKLPAKAEFY